jgi:hypothetical protein
VSTNNSCLTKRNNGFTVTPIKDNQFLVECDYKALKIIGENEYSITYISIEDGPVLHIGRDFLGMGLITGLEVIETESEGYLIIKVITRNIEDNND